MVDEREFNATRDLFSSDEKYEKYRNTCRCAVCHEKLEIGDKWQFKSIQTPEEAGGLTVQAVIVHSKCLAGRINDD